MPATTYFFEAKIPENAFLASKGPFLSGHFANDPIGSILLKNSADDGAILVIWLVGEAGHDGKPG